MPPTGRATFKVSVWRLCRGHVALVKEKRNSRRPRGHVFQARRLQARPKKRLSEFPPVRNEAQVLGGQKLNLLGAAEKGFTRALVSTVAAWDLAHDGSIRRPRPGRLLRDVAYTSRRLQTRPTRWPIWAGFTGERHENTWTQPLCRNDQEDSGSPEEAEGDIRVDGVQEAVIMFARAAGEGSTLAMFNLGVAFLKGAGGLQKSVDEARRWFEKCGTPDALHALAKTHWDAFQDSGREDADHAYVRTLRRAAEWGSAEAQTDLRRVMALRSAGTGTGRVAETSFEP